MKKNTILYSLAVVLLSGIGLLEFERGFFWTKEQNDILDDSDFYLALHHIMPIWVWGVLGMICSILSLSHRFLTKTKIKSYL